VLRSYCRRHGIRCLRLLGPTERNELRDDSDVHLLVEFEPGQTAGPARRRETRTAENYLAVRSTFARLATAALLP
jgi:predicted nucleotidyltransferase